METCGVTIGIVCLSIYSTFPPLTLLKTHLGVRVYVCVFVSFMLLHKMHSCVKFSPLSLWRPSFPFSRNLEP